MTRSSLSHAKRGFVVPLALVALTTSALAAVTSGAFFTDSQVVQGDAFVTGSVKLSASHAATKDLSVGDMAPGDSKVGTLTVANTGSLAERYSMRSAATNADNKGLATALQTTVKTGVAACTASGFASTGTILYSGILGSPSGTALLGDPAQGQQAGDRVLAAGETEELCVRVTLPGSAGNALQNASTTASFQFDAEQVINNP